MNFIFPLAVTAVMATALILRRRSWLAPDVARKYIAEGALVIDVRTKSEFIAGHLPKAVNLPLGEFAATLPNLVSDRNRVLLLHCQSGGRSALARRQALSLGYANSYNLGSLARVRQVAEAQF